MERLDDATADPAPEPSDHSLLRRLRDGQDSAANDLYFRYARRLHALARARCSADLAREVEAEDIVQSVFGSFFRGVRQGRYDVPPGQELWGLLLVLALNKIRAHGNYHRAARRDISRTTSGGDLLDGWLGQEEDGVALTTLQMVIDETLARLALLPREMVVLRIQGYEVGEIADLTHRSRRTVERVLQDFRRQLAAVLEEGGA